MKFLGIVLSASALLAAAASPAGAQQAPARPERPYRGLFGGDVGNAEQLLTLNVGVGAGYDDNALAGPSERSGASLLASQARQGGGFSSVSGELAYTLTRPRVGLNASAATSGRYYPELVSDRFVASQTASVGAFMQVAKKTRLLLRHTTTHQPYLTLGSFPALFDVPGQAVLPPQEFGVNRGAYFSHVSDVGITQALGRRTTLSLNYGYRRNDFEDAERNLSGPTAGGRLTVLLKKGLGIYGGYRYTGARFGTAQDRTVTGGGIDAGVDFNRALSFSRRTTLSFATGSMAVSNANRTVYRLTGRAALNHEIGRSWNASLAYGRDVHFIETFPQPVFADSVSLGVSGLLGRKLQFHSRIAGSFGEFAFTSAGSGFDTYSGSTGLTYGISRSLGLGVSYAYYRYSFDASVPLPAGFSREIDRQSVQANLNVWVPLMHRSRRPDASR